MCSVCYAIWVDVWRNSQTSDLPKELSRRGSQLADTMSVRLAVMERGLDRVRGGMGCNAADGSLVGDLGC